MPVKTLVITVLAALVGSSVASAQVLNESGNCVSPTSGASAEITTANPELVTLQSRVVTTRTIPVAARLLSSRVVARGWAPVSSLNSPLMSSSLSFGSASVPLTGSTLSSSALSNSLVTVQPFSSVGFQPAVGASTLLTVSVPQTFSSTQFVTGSPVTAKVLAARIANENCRSEAAASQSVAKVQSSNSSCCSAKSLQSLSTRLEKLDAILKRLETSQTRRSGNNLSDPIDDLLPGGDAKPNDVSQPSDDPIGDLLGDSVE